MKECPYPNCSATKLMEAAMKMVEDVKGSNTAYRAEIRDQVGGVREAVEKLVSSDRQTAVMVQKAISANELVSAAILDLKDAYRELKKETGNIFDRLRELEDSRAKTERLEKLEDDIQMIERNMVTKADIAKLLGAFALLLTIIQVVIAIVK